MSQSELSMSEALPAAFLADPAAYMAASRARRRAFYPPPKLVHIARPLPPPPPTPKAERHPLAKRCYRAPLRFPPAPMKQYVFRPVPGSILDIQLAVCKAYNMSLLDLVAHNRNKGTVEARMVAMWLVKQLAPKKSLPEIGRRFGNRDHTTVLHSVRKINDLVSSGRFELKPELAEMMKSRRCEDSAHLEGATQG